MIELTEVLERTVIIRAMRTTVFSFFTNSEYFARWWGAGSSIEPHPGGRVLICYSNGVRAGGEVLAIEPEESITFSFGYESGDPIPIGASRIEIHLCDHKRGTLLELKHAFADATHRDMHIGGWRYQLAVFAFQTTGLQHENVVDVADGWFAAWCETDADQRRIMLEKCVTEDVRFADAYGCCSGLEDLNQHIAAAQTFMPGTSIVRRGIPRQCQGTALVDWSVVMPDGSPGGDGTNVMDLAADGRITRVTGIRN